MSALGIGRSDQPCGATALVTCCSTISRVDRISLGVSGFVGFFVATVLSQAVLFRASWLLASDFDRNAFLIRLGSGPMVGLVLLLVGVITFWGCRTMLGRFGMRPALKQEPDGVARPESRLRGALATKASLFAVCGIGAGLLVGAALAWTLIAVDGMGNGGDTSIVRYQVRDFVQASLLGMGVFLAAAVSLRARTESNS